MRHTQSDSVQFKVYGPANDLRYSVTSGRGLTVDDAFMLARDHFMGAPAGSAMYRSDSGGCIPIASPGNAYDRPMSANGRARLALQRSIL